MSKKLLFNLNKNVSQDYTYVKYTGTIVTATNTLEKPIKNAILKGDTKYRDVDTGEILDSFDGTKNLELVSVKMPVLQTMGKNLFDGIVKENHYVTIVEYDGKRCVSITARNDLDGLFEFTTPIPCMKGLILSCMIQSAWYCKIRPVFEDGTFGNPIGGWLGFPEWTRTSYEIPQNSKRLRGFVTSSSGNTTIAYLELTTIQIEEGSNATSHESYKTNILTTPKDFELKGLADVKDTLDCNTRECIQRVGKTTMRGDMFPEIMINPINCNSETICFERLNKRFPFRWNQILSADWLISNDSYSNSLTHEYFNPYNGYGIFRIKRSRLETEDVVGFKKWLDENPITIYHPLAEPIIKTVDLSILDQDENTVTSISSFNDTTHVTTSSDTVPPIFEGYIATKESVE